MHACLTSASYANSDYADQVWIWENEGSSFYFDIGEVVRFRVEMEEWHDQIPNAPDLGDGTGMERKAPYSIIVSVVVVWMLESAWVNLFLGIYADGWLGADIVVVMSVFWV